MFVKPAMNAGRGSDNNRPQDSRRERMVMENGMDYTAMTGEVVLCRIELERAAALGRILSAAGIDCRLVPDADGCVVLVEERDAELAEILLAKRKKDVEDEEESDDEEEEEDDDLEEDEEDEDDDFDDEDEDEFEEEFDDDELDDDDDDIFYDDDDDE
jgi:hypothetical protein